MQQSPDETLPNADFRMGGSITEDQAKSVYQTMVDVAESRYQETLATIRAGRGGPGQLELAKLDRDEAVQRAKDYATANGWEIPELGPVNTPQEIFDNAHPLHRTAALGRDANGYPDGIFEGQLEAWRAATKDYKPNAAVMVNGAVVTEGTLAAQRNAEPAVKEAMARIEKWLDGRSGPDQKRELLAMARQSEIVLRSLNAYAQAGLYYEGQRPR
jgi:hypothetical protein